MSMQVPLADYRAYLEWSEQRKKEEEEQETEGGEKPCTIPTPDPATAQDAPKEEEEEATAEEEEEASTNENGGEEGEPAPEKSPPSPPPSPTDAQVKTHLQDLVSFVRGAESREEAAAFLQNLLESPRCELDEGGVVVVDGERYGQLGFVLQTMFGRNTPSTARMKKCMAKFMKATDTGEDGGAAKKAKPAKKEAEYIPTLTRTLRLF